MRNISHLSTLLQHPDIFDMWHFSAHAKGVRVFVQWRIQDSAVRRPPPPHEFFWLFLDRNRKKKSFTVTNTLRKWFLSWPPPPEINHQLLTNFLDPQLFLFLGIPFVKNGNPLGISFLPVFEHAEMFRHIFSFLMRQVTMGSRVPQNEESYFKSLRAELRQVPASWEPDLGFRS